MAGLFLPFTPKGKAIELKAIAIKRDFDFGPYDLIDPRELARRMDVALSPKTGCPGLRRASGRRSWSITGARGAQGRSR